jgi:hypothetical protein
MNKVSEIKKSTESSNASKLTDSTESEKTQKSSSGNALEIEKEAISLIKDIAYPGFWKTKAGVIIAVASIISIIITAFFLHCKKHIHI